MAGRRTIIGSKALMLAARGEKEMAAQIFDYTLIREVRADLDELEVKILTTYDDSFYRIFKVKLEEHTEEKIEEGRKLLIKFYNDLLNATMRFSKEEMKQLLDSNTKLQEKIKNKQKPLATK